MGVIHLQIISDFQHDSLRMTDRAFAAIMIREMLIKNTGERHLGSRDENENALASL